MVFAFVGCAAFLAFGLWESQHGDRFIVFFPFLGAALSVVWLVSLLVLRITIHRDRVDLQSWRGKTTVPHADIEAILFKGFDDEPIRLVRTGAPSISLGDAYYENPLVIWAALRLAWETSRASLPGD
jgi:hypothetical protein